MSNQEIIHIGARGVIDLPEEREFFFTCNCGTEKVQFTSWSDGWLFISLWEQGFYSRQIKFSRVVVDRIRAAWQMLRGRGYRFYEITLREDDISRFKEWVAGIEVPEKDGNGTDY